MSEKPEMPFFCLFKIGQTVRHKKSGDLYFIIGQPTAGVTKVGNEWRPAYFYSPVQLNAMHLHFSREQHDFEAKFESVRSVVTEPKVGDTIVMTRHPFTRRIVVDVTDALQMTEGGWPLRTKTVAYRIVGDDMIYYARWPIWIALCKESAVDTLAD